MQIMRQQESQDSVATPKGKRQAKDVKKKGQQGDQKEYSTCSSTRGRQLALVRCKSIDLCLCKRDFEVVTAVDRLNGRRQFASSVH